MKAKTRMTGLTLAVATLAVTAVPAQEKPPGAELAPRQQRLQRALQTMLALPAVSFRTEESRDLAAFRGQGGRAVMFGADGMGGSADGVAGTWTPDLLSVTCNDGADRLALRGQRTIARTGDGPWHFRSGRLASGNSAPRIVDPMALLTALSELNPKVAKSEVGTRDDRPVEYLTVTLKGKPVAELIWGGFLPENGTGGIWVGARSAVEPKALLDLCFSIDPATGLIHEIRTHSYAKDSQGGVVFLGGPAAAGIVVKAEPARPAVKADEKGEPKDPPKPGAKAAGEQAPPKVEPAKPVAPVAVARASVTLRMGGGGDQEDLEAEEPPPEKFDRGMPVRSKDGKDVASFTITFTDHGHARPPELDDQARRLLGLQRQPR